MRQRKGANKTHKLCNDASIGDIRHHNAEDSSQGQSAAVESKSLL